MINLSLNYSREQSVGKILIHLNEENEVKHHYFIFTY